MKKHLYHRKPVDELTFTDDGMFQAVMRDPDLCAELVERLLNIKVSRIEYPELEKTIAPFFSSKGVRLDVYIKDSDKVLDLLHRLSRIAQIFLLPLMPHFQSLLFFLSTKIFVKIGVLRGHVAQRIATCLSRAQG